MQSMDPVRRGVHGPGVSIFGSPVHQHVHKSTWHVCIFVFSSLFGFDLRDLGTKNL